MKYVLATLFYVIISGGCGVSPDVHKKVLEEIELSRTQLDEVERSETRATRLAAQTIVGLAITSSTIEAEGVQLTEEIMAEGQIRITELLLSPKLVKASVHSAVPDITAYHARWRPVVEGRVTVYFLISPAGDVSEASILEADFNYSSEYEACMTGVLRHLKFPKSDLMSRIVYPFVFQEPSTPEGS